MNSSVPTNHHQPLLEHSDNVNEELQRIQVALSVVFSPGRWSNNDGLPEDAASMLLRQREVADRYLTSFQHLPIAWMVCDQMLQEVATERTVEMLTSRHFFAAQTLHTKCREDVHQLPPSSLPSLRESLVHHFLRFATSAPPSPRALVTRLGLALSSLAVQMAWTSVVPDMLDRYRNQQQHHYTSAILDLFHLLPEEACSNRLFLVNEQLQEEYRMALNHSAPEVLELLMSVLRQAEQQLQQQQQQHEMTVVLQHFEKIFLCLQTWLRYTRIHPQVMEKYFYLIHAAFRALTQIKLLEVSVDVIVELMRSYPTSPNAQSNSMMYQRVVPCVLALQTQPEHFTQAMREEDHDRLRGYCRIVIELGESCMSWILSAATEQQGEDQPLKDQVVDLALLCSAIPENDFATYDTYRRRSITY